MCKKVAYVLVQCTCSCSCSKLSGMFNVEFSLENMLNCCRIALNDLEQQEYTSLSSAISGQLMAYNMFIQMILPVTKWQTGGYCIVRVEEKCRVHSKKCQLPRHRLGFLWFFNLLIDDTEPPQIMQAKTSSKLPIENDGREMKRLPSMQKRKR